MTDEIEKYFIEKGCLVEEKVIREIVRRGGINYIRKNEKRLDFSKPIFTMLNLPSVNEFSIVKEFNLNGFPGVSSTFVDIFRTRYSFLSSKINERTRNHFFSPVSKIHREKGKVSVSGEVISVTTSKKGYLIAEIEDLEKSIKVIFPRNFKEIIFQDEVIGITGNLSDDGKAIFAENIYRPEVSKQQVKTEEGVKVMVVSDIHVGSKNFMNDSFKDMIEYTNSEGISFLIMNGDLVDGIGVYPNQEDDLEIRDVVNQYKELSRLLMGLNSNVRVVLIPGNHDIVYPTEPQNPLPREISSLFPSNVTSLSNPVWVEIGQRTFLLYHGTSIMDFIESMPGTTLNDSGKVMKEMLRRGHLAPIYGRNLSFIPLKEDYYIIDPVPDVLITGHIHDHSISNYNGILTINASTFQEQTSYQKMMNFNPKPAIGTVVDTSDLSVYTVKF
jgi:DNA polymerase II small subunit